MSKIVIDGRESGTSTGRYLDKLVEYLHQLKPKHEIIVLAKPHRFEYLRKVAPSFTLIETPFKEFTFDEQLGFKKQIESLQPDLVHFPMVQQPVLYRGRVVTTMQDLTTIRFRNPTKNSVVFWVKQQVYKWVNKRVAHKSDAIIAPTQFVKDDVVNYTHIKPSKITVTLECADLIKDKPEPVAGLENKRFIMYTGRPTPHKNLGRLIDAFAALHKSRPDLYLVLVGKKDGNYTIHEANVAAKGIPNVIFTGFVSDGQLKWLYQHCAAYIFPSLSEGFGLPGLEAMTHGAPVASSNATCLPEVHGDAAQYFDPLDVVDMAVKIGEVIDNPELRKDLIAKGKKQAAKYSWERMAKQTLAVYESVLKR
ncbi:MAG TPA: glycosyltransferase family 1 protein [Candidatus Saccharimonadales bacterium]|nr:glycosyltransferase family 1 protein [Candidatus Saccharimonadales bacterium]